MKTDPRLEEDIETPEKGGLLHRIRQAVKLRQLHALDGFIGFFQHWRSSIEPPPEDDDWRGGRRHGGTEPAHPADVTAAPHHGFRRFLVVFALLLAAGIGGMMFSYTLLSQAIESDELVIDDLRDQLEQMHKNDARNISIQAKDQVRIAEQKKTIREYEAKLDEYEGEIAQLRQQVAAMTPRRAPVPVAATPYRAPPRAAPQKTGKCTASGSSAAADIARCLEDFNRP
ncbi:MAG TPA: hypothetical protein VK477_02720 [Acidobacteriota bacterium]|nr:hypothetical protein [Acidobacteriota bacterium]